MRIFRRRRVNRRNEGNDVKEETRLLRELEAVSSMSKDTQKRIDKIVDIERVRLRNLELRAEILGRVRMS